MKRAAIIGLHVCYWGMYILLVSLFLLVELQSGHLPVRLFRYLLFMPGSLIIGPGVVGFYLSYYFCFRLLQRKRLWSLFVLTVTISVVAVLLSLSVMHGLLGSRVLFRWSWDTAAETAMLSFIAFVNVVLALVIRGFVTWYGDIRLKELLRRRNTDMELALLKSQLNPHFLFNTLNNIDVLIEKDAVRASDYLNKLSGLLRFMLYEAGAERIAMDKELQYIERYIELQRIRTAYPESIRYIVEGEPGRWMVAPMLFLPFIENAFKHAEKKAGDAVLIRFELGAERIVFHCENRIGAGTDAPGGLGNSLIRKRLDLLYPGKHQLEIDAGEHRYKATLILEGHEV